MRETSAWDTLARVGAIADTGELTVVALLPDDSTASLRHALRCGATAAAWWVVHRRSSAEPASKR